MFQSWQRCLLARSQPSRLIDRAFSSVRFSLTSDTSAKETGTKIDHVTKDTQTTELVSLFKENSSEGSVQLVYTPKEQVPRCLLVNNKTEMNTTELRTNIFNIVSALQKHKITQATINIDDFSGVKATKEEVVDHIVRTAKLTTYKFDKYKKPKEEQVNFEHLQIASSKTIENLEKVVETSAIEIDGVIKARDLSNEQADVVNPDFIQQQAEEIAHANKEQFKVTVIKGQELVDKQLNLLYAVGQAARWEPRLILLEYNPTTNTNNITTNKNNESETIAIVGKCITYDTGGLNLKPTGSMETMHMDMSGAAAVLGAASVISKLHINQRVVFVVTVAENAISEKAYKPGCIVKSFEGKTVEVGNTDAEGRLALADALSYVQATYKPTTIIDLATLTGACVVALGEYAAGLFSNNKQLSDDIISAGEKSMERCWPMPILKEHTSELDSAFADIKSIGKGRYGGACTAAAFLQSFIKEGVHWAHLDIAGPAMYSAQREYINQGGTGFGVQTILNFLRARQHTTKKE